MALHIVVAIVEQMFRINASYDWSSLTAQALGGLLGWLAKELPETDCFVSSWETVMVPQNTLGLVGITLNIGDVGAFLEPSEFHFDWLSLVYPRAPLDVLPEGTAITVDGERRLWTNPPATLYPTSLLEVYVSDSCSVICIGRSAGLGRRLESFLATADPSPGELEALYDQEG